MDSLVLTWGVCVALFSAQLGANEAQAASSTTHFDFGKVLAGTVVRHEFTLLNDGDEVKQITEIKTSCSCSVVKDTPRVLKPHSRTPLSVQMNTSHKSGRVMETVNVKFSDGSISTFVLNGFVESDYVAEVDFGKIRRDDPNTKRLFAVDTTGFEIERVTENSDYMAVRPTGSRLSQAEFEVTLVPVVPYGKFSDEIFVYTTDPVKALKRVRVKGEVLFPVISEPQRVMLGECKSGETKQVTIKVMSPYLLPLKIERIENEDGSITFKTTSLSDSAKEVEFDFACGPSESKVIRSVIQIVTRVADKQETIKVEVHGLRSRS